MSGLTEPAGCSRPKLLLVFLFSCLAASGNLLIRASKDSEAKVPYMFITVSLLAEVIKLVVSLTVAIATLPLERFSCPGLFYYAVPALLYALDNNLTFLILELIDPPTLAVCWNLKIVITAILFRCIFKRRLSQVQWCAICLLLFGIIGAESDAGTTREASASAEGKKEAALVVWVPLVLLAITIASLAGLYSEWILKKREEPFALQNCQMYLFGVLFNCVGLFLRDSQRLSEKGFFDGYNWWAVAVMLVQASAGLAAGVIFKFLDNIAAVFGHAVAMLLTMWVSVVVFDFKVTPNFLCGMGTSVIAIYLYHTAPLPAEHRAVAYSELPDLEAAALFAEGKKELDGVGEKRSPRSLRGQNSSPLERLKGHPQTSPPPSPSLQSRERGRSITSPPNEAAKKGHRKEVQLEGSQTIISRVTSPRDNIRLQPG